MKTGLLLVALVVILMAYACEGGWWGGRSSSSSSSKSPSPSFKPRGRGKWRIISTVAKEIGKSAAANKAAEWAENAYNKYKGRVKNAYNRAKNRARQWYRKAKNYVGKRDVDNDIDALKEGTAEKRAINLIRGHGLDMAMGMKARRQIKRQINGAEMEKNLNKY